MKHRMRTYLVAVVALSMVAGVAAANDIAPFQTVFNTDYAVAGVGGLRNTGTGTITLSGVSGPVNKAYLYWHGPTSSTDPAANGTIFVNGTMVVGTQIGFSSDNCWGFANSQGYRADVTALVSGDGVYVLTGLGSSATVNSNGASLVVFFNDGNPANNRDVVMFDGNDSNIPNSYDADGWNVSLPGINYTSGTAAMQLHVGDGQTYVDDAVVVNGVTIAPAGPVFDGNTVPSANNGPTDNGSLWDIRAFDVTALLSPGPNVLTLTTGLNNDCLSLVLAIVDLPAGAAPNQTITLDPNAGSGCTGTAATITATVKDDTGAAVGMEPVTFTVTSGPNAGQTATVTTAADGTAAFTYTGGPMAGTDAIEACFVDANDVTQCANGTWEWTVCNEPPDTSGATPSVSCIWPPNHKFVPITIDGVTDPDGDPVTITITGIFSDEPTATALGAGGVTHAPDASGIGTSTAMVRAERSGLGDGRVYEIRFDAHDGAGGHTPGVVFVSVAKSMAGKTCSAINSGTTFDASK